MQKNFHRDTSNNKDDWMKFYFIKSKCGKCQWPMLKKKKVISVLAMPKQMRGSKKL